MQSHFEDDCDYDYVWIALQASGHQPTQGIWDQWYRDVLAQVPPCTNMLFLLDEVEYFQDGSGEKNKSAPVYSTATDLNVDFYILCA